MKVWVYRSRNGNHRVFTGDLVGFEKARAMQDDDNRCTLDDLEGMELDYGGSVDKGYFWIDDGGTIDLFEVE